VQGLRESTGGSPAVFTIKQKIFVTPGATGILAHFIFFTFQAFFFFY